MPVLTVDIVIIRRGKFLLLKRAIAPAKNQWGTSSHTPSIFFLAHPVPRWQKIKINFNNSETIWFSHIPRRLNTKLKKMIQRAGFQ